MRLTPEQIAIIRQTAEEAFGPGVRVWLFGSRVDDQARGGDIDLLIRPPQFPTEARAECEHLLHFHALLERKLGERKIDVLIEKPSDPRPIVHIAHEQGVEL